MASPVRVLSIAELNRLTRSTKSEISESRRYETIEEAKQLWSDLLATIHDPLGSERHMTAACNAICFLARNCSRSTSDEVRSFSFSSRTWAQAFDAVLCAFACGKNKPALQVLDTLAHLAEANPEKQRIAQSVTQAITEMAKIVFNQHPKKSLKEACIVLYFFLRKLSDFMCFSDVLEQASRGTRLNFSRLCCGYGISWRITDRQSDSQWFAFVLSLLMAVRVAESRSATLKLLSLFATHPMLGHGIDLLGIVNEAIEVYSAADETALDDVSRDVLPSIMTNSEQYHTFLFKRMERADSSASAVQVILALLQFGKRQGFVSEDELPKLVNEILFKSGDQTYSGFKHLLSNASPAIRLRTCELLTLSNSPKKLAPAEALTCLTDSLRFLHDDTDAFHRGELLSTFRRFLTRLCVSRAVHTKSSQLEHLSYVDKFLRRYTMFLLTELAPQLPYGRHILALDLICVIMESRTSGGHPFPKSVMADRKLLYSLFRLVSDPYDDVRATATRALSYAKVTEAAEFSVVALFKDVVNTLKPTTSASTLAAATKRADHADALGRVISLMHTTGTVDLCEGTENQSNQPRNNLVELVQDLCAYLKSIEAFNVSTQYPLHGNILGISYIVRNTRTAPAASPATPLQEGLLAACQQIWTLSQPHLCVDSPEIETELAEEAASLGPKDSLAYAWRALRDANLLMQAILESFSPEIWLLESIGSMCFEQLALLRHRGAFSTVAQTYVLCCQKTRSSDHIRSHALLGQWFSRALDELERQADKLTRRSAGLPAIFIALLHPYDQEQFSIAFQALGEIVIQEAPQASEASSQDRLRLPQVHALNCIKDIMTASRFRTMTEPLVVSTINMAAKCMGSPIWAIKNCGLMLLRASINRLDPDTSLGASEAGLSERGTQSLTSGPFQIALALLGKNMEETASALGCEPDRSTLDEAFHGSAEGEFAGLDLLGRLYMVEHEHAMARTVVMRKLHHSLWHIRARAARLLAEITPQGAEFTTLHEVLNGFESVISMNEGHGRFLVAQNLLRRMHANLQSDDYLPRFVGLLVNAAAMPSVSQSSIVAAMWLELATELLGYASAFPDEQMKVYIACKQHIMATKRPSGRTYALFDQAFGLFLVSALSVTESVDIKESLLGLTSDEDVALHVISHMPSVVPNRALVPVADLLRSATFSQAPHDIRAAAMDASSSLLRSSCLAPHEITQQIDFRSFTSRDLMNAQLRAYACLAEQFWSKQALDDLVLLKASAKGFCIHLRVAASDELEDMTRRAAVEALHEWKGLRSIKEMLDHLFDPSDKFEITSVLYDLLNDDDDEIRFTAAETTAGFLTHVNRDVHKDANRAANMLCAAASREKLREQFIHQFGDTDILGHECWRRILGINMNTARSRLKTVIAIHLDRNGVACQLSNIMAAANDLFAEEKQNQYADEITEVRIWAGTAARIDLDVVGLLPFATVSWVTDGLRALTHTLIGGDLETSMHYNPDFELLLVRVITIARIVGTFQQELHELQQNCTHSNTSETVLSAFTWSLG